MSRLEIEAFSPKVRAMEMALHWCCAGPHTPRRGTRTTERPTTSKKQLRDAIGALTATWSRLGHEIGFGIGIAHGFATLGTIGFEGRFDYAAIGTVSNVASRLCDEAKPGQILISPRVLMKVENAVKVEPVGEFELKGIRRPLAAYNVVGAVSNG